MVAILIHMSHVDCFVFEHLFICFKAICTSLENYLLKSFVLFSLAHSQRVGSEGGVIGLGISQRVQIKVLCHGDQG